MSKSYTIANPEAPLSVDQRGTLVKLVNNKSFALADSFLDHDGEAVEFEDGSPVTFGDLAIVEAIDPAKPVAPGNRHYPVICGLTKGQASGAIQALFECPDKQRRTAKPSNGGNRNSAKPSSAASQQDMTTLVAETVMGVLAQIGLIDAPAKPEPAKVAKVAKPATPVPTPGHSKAVANPAKPVATVPVKLAEGQIVEWDGQLYELTRQANGRIGQRRIEIDA